MQSDDATRNQTFMPRPEDTFVYEKARSEKHLWRKIRDFIYSKIALKLCNYTLNLYIFYNRKKVLFNKYTRVYKYKK